MMKKQSLDFIVGYLFNTMDKNIFKHFNCHKSTLVESHRIPKLWFGLSSCHDITNDIISEEKYELIQKLQNGLNQLYPELETICEKIVPENQFIRFYFRVKYRELVRKMTVREIEKALGYKIEIVSDK